MSVLETQRLRALEKENSRLKRLLANKDLEIDALREIVSKQMVTVEQKRETIRVLKDRLSERKSCRLLGIDRSSMRYQPTTRLEIETAFGKQRLGDRCAQRNCLKTNGDGRAKTRDY